MKRSLSLTIYLLTVISLQNIHAQVIYGEPIETLEYRLEQDSSLYDQLAERFHAADSTLTLNQLSLIYYGYALRPEFDPVQEERILDAANSLARRDRYEDAINLLDNFLQKHPGSLAALLERAYTAWLVEDSLGTVEGFKKYYMLMDVPMNSGNGNSAEEAFVINSVRDIELILDQKGYIVQSQSLIKKDGQDHYLVTSQRDDETKQKKVFYFNVELPMQRGRQRSLMKKQ